MTLLLKKSDLASLLTEPTSIEESFEVIKQSLINSDKTSAYTSVLAYPLGASSNKLIFNLVAAPSGTSLRIFPSPTTPTAATANKISQLFDEQGRLIAIADFGDVGAWRTSGAAAFACRVLAPDNAKVAAVIGSGLEARTFVTALKVAVPSIDRIRVYSRTPENRERFAQEMSDSSIKVVATEQSQAAVEGADIIYEAAASRGQPAMEASWIKPGALVNSIVWGWGTIPTNLQARWVIPDKKPPEQRTTGWEPWPINTRSNPDALSLAEVLRGTPARQSPDQTIVFMQAGVFAWDAALVNWAYQKAVKNNWGTDFDFSS